MEEKNKSMQRFFVACDELITGKFILADTKIGELLRSVATCDELMGLFSAVTKNFDYQAAKRDYLHSPDDTRTARGAAYLPSDETELLAFVFCLLVEFDSGAMKLNDFLLRYFYEDGSYTASYALFVARVIRPFRDVVRRCYPDSEKWGTASMQRRREDGILSSLSEKVTLERARLSQLQLSREDAYAGEVILAELYVAVGRKDIPEIKALLCGYLYYLQVIKGTSENSGELFHLGGEL